MLNRPFFIVVSILSLFMCSLASIEYSGTEGGNVENGGFVFEIGVISGKVIYCEGYPYVPRTEVWISGDTTAMVLTDNIGRYSFPNVKIGGEYCIRPHKEGEVGHQTVTSLDAVIVARMIVDLIRFDECDSLAADVNYDGRINVLDVVHILRYVVGYPPSQHVGEWKFILEEQCYDSLPSSLSDQDFVAVIVGDVTQNWVEPSPPNKVGRKDKTSTEHLEDKRRN